VTYYGAGDLAAAFRQVRSNTIQIAEEIPEDKYGFRATHDTRSVAQLLVHIAVAPRFQLHVHRNGIADFQTVNFLELIGPLATEETKARTKAEITALLIYIRLEEYEYGAATAIATVVLAMAFVVMLATNALQAWQQRYLDKG